MKNKYGSQGTAAKQPSVKWKRVLLDASNWDGWCICVCPAYEEVIHAIWAQ